MSSALHRPSHLGRRLLLAQVLGFYLVALVAPQPLRAAPSTPPASLAQVPQVLQFPPAPNVFITLDNSGSMALEYLPLGDDQNRPRLFPHPISTPYSSSGSGGPTGSVFSPDFVRFEHTLSVARARSASHNLMYYNPRIRYRPWKYADAAGNVVSYPEAADPPDDTFALYHPLFPSRGGLDLASSTVSTGSDSYTARLVEGDSSSPTVPFALYYNFDTSRPGCDPVDPANDLDCYERVEIKPSVATYVIPPGNQRGQPDEPGCAPVGGQMRCNYKAEFKNFANWFQYYRSRTLMARGAMGNALAELGPGFRVGFGLLNSTDNSTGPADGFSSTTVRLGVRPFEGANRKPVFDLLHNHDVRGNTPSARALFEVGQYFDWKNGSNPHERGPWSNDPAAGLNEFAACRQSYHIYVTDGYWNESGRYSSPIPPAVDNADTTEGPEICRPMGAPIPQGQPPCYRYRPTDVGETSGPKFSAFGAPGPNNLGNPNNRRFTSTESRSLADIAMYFWYRDLQPAMPNIVAPSSANPAFWQNLSLMAVSLGLVGTKTHLGDAFLTALDNGTDFWPTGLNPDGADSKTIDDLWHAAVNSRGSMLLANNPQEFAARLSAALTEIRARSSNAAGAASSSAFLDDGTAAFTAEFVQGVWSGDLYRREFVPGTLQFKTNDANGNPLPRDSNGQPYVWRASAVLPNWDSRRIFTLRTDGSRVEFRPSSWPTGGVDAAQESLLASPLGGAEDVINYLRGDRSKEQGNVPPGNFRDRPRAATGSADNVLGTIANSTPLYVKSANFLYNFLPPGTPGRDTYLAFQRANQGNGATIGPASGRTPLVWVGSNGGMFHAFNAITDASRGRVGGAEVFAYVPRSVIRNLSQLVEPTYQHRLYVDGVPSAGDAYFGPSCPNVDANGVDQCWRTIVVSSLGAGGRGVFAIDATRPESLGASSILWEVDEYSLSSTDYQLLGHTFGPALVARVKDNMHPTGGRWVAVFGNGPESDAKRAALFVVDLETGAKVAVLDTGDGDAANPNGLSAPAPLLDGNRQLIGVYAGDLRGNLWKFDLSGPNPSTWSVAFGGAPMFQARDRNGKRQPIHARPLIVPHPVGGVLVVFGTGKIFSPGDRENVDEQTLYGVRDNLAGNPAIDANFRSGSAMVQQAITEKSGSPVTYYLTSFPVDYSATGGKRGWFLDLGVSYRESGSGLDPASAALVTPGERMVAMPSALGDTLLALSLVPGTDPCAAGGVSFLYALNLLTGSFVGARSFAGDRSGAIQTVAGSGLLPFLMRGRARHGDGVPGSGQPPDAPPPNEPPPRCQPGFEPVWVVPQAGGPGHWECVPVGNARDIRTWRQIIE